MAEAGRSLIENVGMEQAHQRVILDNQDHRTSIGRTRRHGRALRACERLPANRHGHCDRQHRLTMFVPDPHTDLRVAALREALVADLGRSLNGHDLGGIQILQLEAFLITGEAVPVQHVKVKATQYLLFAWCLRTTGEAFCSPETMNSLIV
jgi:hypothetical protein